MLDSPHGLFNAVEFHSQQAAEKALKAYLTWRDKPFEKTHSLVALVGMCLVLDDSFEDLRLASTTLTPYAVTTRYPGDLPELTRNEAQEAQKLAQHVWGFVIGHLPPEIHPEE